MMKTAYLNYKLKIDTPWHLIIHKFNKILFGKRRANEMAYRHKMEYLRKKYLKVNIWNFDGILLPNSPEIENQMLIVYPDSLFVYCIHDDNYESSLVDELDNLLPEGTYSYKTKDFDVTIHSNDIVIDAGAWIGDFSAYASQKGATVYAFEPAEETFGYLTKTQILNSNNIYPIQKGLGDQKGFFFITSGNNNSIANHITTNSDYTEKIEVTTIDSFIIENNLDRVDFIKADIEGYERNMLLGAKETLRRFAPKLAICTYHLPDDSQVLAKIILDANPNYRIIQKRKKLYAAVLKT